MTLVEVIIQGIIQGITEFLPISSSGHLSVFQHLFGLSGNDSMMLTVILHLGTLVAVFIAFRKMLWEIVKEFFRVIGDIFTKKNIFRDINDSRRMLFMVIVGTVPLVGAYFLSDLVKGISTDNDIIIEGICFTLTGLLLFVAFFKDRGYKGIKDMRVGDAIFVGIAQLIAILPGISRSGTTAAAGSLRKLNKETVISFSFILGIPAIIAAAASELLSKETAAISISLPFLAIGFLTSLIFGLITIGLIRWLMRKERYTIFSYYLFIVGAMTITLGILERTI